jgi:hypothetical protein
MLTIYKKLKPYQQEEPHALFISNIITYWKICDYGIVKYSKRTNILQKMNFKGPILLLVTFVLNQYCNTTPKPLLSNCLNAKNWQVYTFKIVIGVCLGAMIREQLFY